MARIHKFKTLFFESLFTGDFETLDELIAENPMPNLEFCYFVPMLEVSSSNKKFLIDCHGKTPLQVACAIQRQVCKAQLNGTCENMWGDDGSEISTSGGLEVDDDNDGSEISSRGDFSCCECSPNGICWNHDCYIFLNSSDASSPPKVVELLLNYGAQWQDTAVDIILSSGRFQPKTIWRLYSLIEFYCAYRNKTKIKMDYIVELCQRTPQLDLHRAIYTCILTFTQGRERETLQFLDVLLKCLDEPTVKMGAVCSSQYVTRFHGKVGDTFIHAVLRHKEITEKKEVWSFAVQLVELFIRFGVNVDAANDCGETAPAIARRASETLYNHFRWRPNSEGYTKLASDWSCNRKRGR